MNKYNQNTHTPITREPEKKKPVVAVDIGKESEENLVDNGDNSDNQERNTMNTTHYIKNLETANDQLRKRNGELFILLQHLNPEAAETVTPIDGFPTQYIVIDSIITHAVEAALATSNQDRDEAMDEVRHWVHIHQNYWQLVAEEKAKRKERAQKREAAKRQAKENDLAVSG